MKNIVLTGFMGTGKTAISAELASLTGFARVEVDAEIENSAGMTITEIFETMGEPRFRDMETETIKRLSERTNTIISTGGGAVMRDDNIRSLRKNGLIVCLTASPETILKRTARNSDRPLLQVESPIDRIRELLEKRAPYYAKADITVDTEEKTPLQVAEEILENAGWKP